MNNYCDFKNSWTLNEYGDLELTEDYTQSIENRIKCPYDYLDIYYEEYGSDFYNFINEEFVEEEILYELKETLNQDMQIQEYEISNISYWNGTIIIDLTINDIEITVSFTEEDINEEIELDEEIEVDEDDEDYEEIDTEGVMEW